MKLDFLDYFEMQFNYSIILRNIKIYFLIVSAALLCTHAFFLGTLLRNNAMHVRVYYNGILSGLLPG